MYKSKDRKKQPLTFAIFLRKRNLCTTFYAFYILTLISTGCSQKKCHNTLYTVTSLHILANFVYFLRVGDIFSWPGAALPHFGRDGKGGDTCFFCPFDKFFGHFFLFFAPMSPDFAHCVTCF